MILCCHFSGESQAIKGTCPIAIPTIDRQYSRSRTYISLSYRHHLIDSLSFTRPLVTGMSSHRLATPVAAPAAAVKNQRQGSDGAHKDKGKKMQRAYGMEVPSPSLYSPSKPST